jgi:hypothetical protein
LILQVRFFAFISDQNKNAANKMGGRNSAEFLVKVCNFNDQTSPSDPLLVSAYASELLYDSKRLSLRKLVSEGLVPVPTAESAFFALKHVAFNMRYVRHLYKVLHKLNPQRVRMDSELLGGRLLASCISTTDIPGDHKMRTAQWCLENGAPAIYEGRDVLHRMVAELGDNWLSIFDVPEGFFRALAAAGLNILQKDSFDKTALDYAFEKLNQPSLVEFFRKLLGAGFKIDALALDKLKPILLEQDQLFYQCVMNGEMPLRE